MVRSRRRRHRGRIPKLNKLTPSQRETRRRVLQAIRKSSLERGENAENRAEEALAALEENRIIKFERSKKFDERDRAGIDFEVWGISPYRCYFTLDVKSSERNANHVREKNQKHHHPLLVEPGDSVKKILRRIVEILTREMEIQESYTNN